MLAETIAFEPSIPQKITDEDVLAALKEIPPNFREIVILADGEEFTYRESAEMLKIPTGTVDVAPASRTQTAARRTRRIRAKLRHQKIGCCGKLRFMNSKNFKDIADSYLSNELLIETNHEVLQHLENCADCRCELGARRELRDVLRAAVQNSPDSQISSTFANKLKNNLRESVLQKEKNWSFIGAKTILAGAFAILVLAVGFGLIWHKSPTPTADLNPNETNKANIIAANQHLNVQQSAFVEARKDAFDDHKNCALKFSLEEIPISLQETAEKCGKFNENLDKAVIKPLRKVFGDRVKFLEAHSCIINGRRFAHVVIKYQERVISVLLTRREDGQRFD